MHISGFRPHEGGAHLLYSDYVMAAKADLLVSVPTKGTHLLYGQNASGKTTVFGFRPLEGDTSSLLLSVHHIKCISERTRSANHKLVYVYLAIFKLSFVSFI